MDNQITLSLEQQFSIRAFETQVDSMSLEQAQQLLKDLYRQMLVKENTYQHLLKHQWGIESE